MTPRDPIAAIRAEVAEMREEANHHGYDRSFWFSRLVALVEALCDVINEMNCQACGTSGTRFNRDLEPVTCNECGFTKLAALMEEGKSE